jgi:hypothetical protein
MMEHVLKGLTRAAWRSVAWPLDELLRVHPTTWWDVASPWVDATSSWTNALPLWSATDAGPVLAALAGDVTSAFRGRRVAIELGGRLIDAELESLSLERREDRYSARVELRSLEWDAIEIQALSVLIDRIALTPPPKLLLVASGVELHARCALEPLVAWLDRSFPDWNLSVTDRHLIQAVQPSGGPQLLLDAAVRNTVLELELRGVRWSRVSVRCPRWLRLSRRITLPALADGVTITDARPHAGGVDLRASLPTLTKALDLGRLRDAILAVHATR